MDHAMYLDEVVADFETPTATDEIEYELSDDGEIVAEVELLRVRVQAARSWGA